MKASRISLESTEVLLDKARTILERGGCSGATLEFLEDLVWFGWDDGIDDGGELRNYQEARMRNIAQLYRA
jgi:hypothetical protein